METLRTERPKLEFLKIFKSYIPLISFAITAAGFILLNQELTVLSAAYLIAYAIIWQIIPCFSPQ